MTSSAQPTDIGIDEARKRFFGLMAEAMNFHNYGRIDFSPLYIDNEEYSKRYMRPVGKSLWHYTSADGLMGIMKQRSIWLSSIFHMNDRTEMFHAFFEFRRRALLLCQRTRQGKHHYFFDYLFSRGMYEHAFMTFVACFSSRGNLLSQWRAYGGSGDRFCLQFSGEKLLDVVRCSICGSIIEDSMTIDDDIIFGFVEVLYDDQIKIQIMDFFLERFVEFLNINNFDMGNQNTIEALELYTSVMLIHFGIMFKDHHFIEEAEWRIYCLARNDPNTKNYVQGRAVKFRNGPYGLTPYFDMRFGPRDQEGVYPLPIEEVMLGPHEDYLRALRTLDYYLHQNGMGHVPSKFCQIPLR